MKDHLSYFTKELNYRTTRIVNNYGDSPQWSRYAGNNLPFEDQSVDFVSSNLGINNFENKNRVLPECLRMLKPGVSIESSYCSV